jgi:hypothetical protein
VFEVGSDAPTVTRLRHQQELAPAQELAIETGVEPFSLRLPLLIPEDALPTLQGGQNSVQWKIVVEERGRGWGFRFKFEFPLTVREVAMPAASGEPLLAQQ